MFRKRSLGLALFLSAAIGILIPGSVHATAIATSQISFSSLQIIPSTSTVVFLDVWTAEAFAQTQNRVNCQINLIRAQEAARQPMARLALLRATRVPLQLMLAQLQAVAPTFRVPQPTIS